MSAAPTAETYVPRLKERYESEIRPQLQEELGVSTPMDVPRVTKVTLNMGVGRRRRTRRRSTPRSTSHDHRRSARAGSRATKSIASFKLREGMPVGARVTLRGARMYEFLDRLAWIALPRIRDSGLDPGWFDGHGDTRSGSGSRSSSPRSTTTRFRRFAASTSQSPRRRRRTRPGARCWVPSVSRSPLPEGNRTRAMAKKWVVVKQNRKPEYAVRANSRCNRCGRPRAVYRKFRRLPDLLRELAHQAAVPGMTKSSW